MKKYFKTYTKKSLALLMTVMMLMSCWVFVAPEHNHVSAVSAATIASTNNSAISALASSLNTDVTTIYGSFEADGDYVETANYDNVYHNVLYTDGAVSKEGGGQAVSAETKYGSSWTGSNSVTIRWYHPTATLMYDGDTSNLPRLGVAMNTIMTYTGTWSRKTVNRLGWVSSGGNGFDFNTNWKGSDSRLNFQWMWHGCDDTMGYTSTVQNDSLKQTLKGDSYDHFYANLLKFTATMSDTEYYRTATPTFGFYGDNGDDGKTITATTTKTIAIINYVPLKNALTKAMSVYNDVKNYPSKYTTDSVAKFAELAKALVAAKPNNYVNSSKNDYTGYATAAKAAVDAYNAWTGLELATYVVTFNSSNGLYNETKSVTYGGSVTADLCPEYTKNEQGHAKFTKWYEGDINTTYSTNRAITVSNVTDDRTITALFDTVEAHNGLGGYTKVDSTHHMTKCSVCGWKNGVADCNFSGEWTANGNTHTQSCACGNTQSHEANWIEKVDANYSDGSQQGCTTDASYYKSCSICGMKHDTDKFIGGAKTGHDYRYVEQVKAHTCTEDGTARYVCYNSCGGEIISDVEINSDGTKTNVKVDLAAHETYSMTYDHTCSAPGYTLVKCINCDYEVKTDNPNDPAAHTWSDKITKKDDSTHGYKCTKCNEWNETAVHTWTLTKTINASTCTTDGSGEYKCNICGATKTDVIPADGKSHVLQNPTSNGDGTHTAHCSECDYKEDAAPCTNNGNCVCSVCGGALAHDYTKADPKSDALKSGADCTTPATYYYSCSVCGKVNKGGSTFTDGEALGHEWTDTKKYIKTGATCEVGTIYYKECSRCNISNKDLTNETWTDTDAKGHDFSGDAVDNGDGTHSFKCVRCDAMGVGTTKGALQACTYGEYTSNGESGHTHKCSVCAHTETTAHTMSKWTFSGTDETKTHTRRCSDGCGYSETANCTEKTIEHKATCLADAYVEHACPDCGNGYTVIKEGTKLEHDYSGAYVSDKNGNHSQLCVNGCNKANPETTACTFNYVKNEGSDTHTATCSLCKYAKTESCSGGEATCIKKAECENCGGEYGTLAKHTFEGDYVNAGDGKHYRKCTTDGCDALGLNGEANKTESCKGGTAYCDTKATCECCGTVYGDFDKTNHNPDKIESRDGLAATCQQEGYTSYDYCSGCDTAIGKITLAIDPTNHSFGGKATSNEDGTHILHCQNKNADGNAQCTETKSFECFDSNPTVTAPTCTEGGYQSNVCEDCGYKWKSDETTPAGHDWSAWSYNDSTGKHERYCLRDASHTETGLCAESTQTLSVIDPTCTEDGYTLHKCNDCSHEWKTDTTPATGHHYTEKIIDDDHKYADKPVSCTNAQYYWYDCADCDKNAKDEKDNDKYPANTLYYENGAGKGHTWEGRVATNEHAILAQKATRTTNATYYIYCTKCGLSSNSIDKSSADYGKTFEDYGSMTNHDYIEFVELQDVTEGEGDDATVTKAPTNKYLVSVATCSSPAVYHKSCKYCGLEGTETFTYGDKLPHTFTEKISDTAHRITKATCTTPATYWYDCATCSLSAEFADKTGMDEEALLKLVYADGTLDSSNHTSLVQVPVKNPTCQEAGYSAHKHCNACNTDIGKTVYAKKDHDYTGAYVIVNDVDENGTVTAYKHKRACKYDCGQYTAVIECQFSDFTQNADGTTHTKSCACGNTVTGECVANSAATCTEAATCKICGGTMGTAGGHDWGEWQSSGDGKTHYRVCKNDATHKQIEKCSGGSAAGCGAINCAICGQQYGTGANHTWGEWIDENPATCTTKATHKRQCSECKTWESEEYGTALGHSYGEGKVTTPATCTKDGVMTYECLRNCGKTKTEVISKLGHEMGEWETAKAPNCKDEGLLIKYCQHTWKDGNNEVKCDYYETMPISADKTKHVSSGKWELVSGAVGSCATGLKYIMKCVNCGEKMDEKTETIPHEWDATHIVKGTCTENGYIDLTCLKCGATAKFDDTCEGWPYQYEDTTIKKEDADSLLSKGGHTWRTQPLEGDTNYTVVEGAIVYIIKAQSCSQTGRGKRVCDVCDTSEEITIPKNEHTMKTIPGSPATCETPGYQAYKACEKCPYQEEPVRIPALGHEDKNGNGKCDRCGFEMYTTPSGGTSACSCICHSKSFFVSKIIYPIARFFWKLFKTNPDCSCGNRHY